MDRMTLSESQYNRVLAQNKQLYQELCARRKVEERIKKVIISLCVYNKWSSEEEFLALDPDDLQDMFYLGQKILKIFNEVKE